MQEYKSKDDLIQQIKKTAEQFISEFNSINESDKDKMVDGVDRTPAQMLAYQLGWLNLIMGWDRDELANKEVIMPHPNYKWNNLGGMYDEFYKQYENLSLSELKSQFDVLLYEFLNWVDGFSNDDLFGQNIRKWASSTPSKWPIWKWIHMNTVSPFGSFRSKIRKWKKQLQ